MWMEEIAAWARSTVTSGSDDGQAENLDCQSLSAVADRFQFAPSIAAQAEIELIARDRFPDGLGMPVELIADGGCG